MPNKRRILVEVLGPAPGSEIAFTPPPFGGHFLNDLFVWGMVDGRVSAGRFTLQGGGDLDHLSARITGTFTLKDGAPVRGRIERIDFFDATDGAAAPFQRWTDVGWALGPALAAASRARDAGSEVFDRFVDRFDYRFETPRKAATAIAGSDGDDLIFAGAGGSGAAPGVGLPPGAVHGGAGDDVIHGSARGDRLSGGPGNDRLLGKGGDDDLRGDGGADRIWGGAGDDLVFGGPGADRIWGGAGADRLSGDGGNDTLWGGAGDDILWGGAGADVLHPGAGNDTLYGGPGRDTFDFTGARGFMTTDIELRINVRRVETAGTDAEGGETTEVRYRIWASVRDDIVVGNPDARAIRPVFVPAGEGGTWFWGFDLGGFRGNFGDVEVVNYRGTVVTGAAVASLSSIYGLPNTPEHMLSETLAVTAALYDAML